MDLQVSNGRMSFLWNQMEEQIKLNGSKEFKTREEILEYMKDIRECRVIGHISRETAKKWKDVDAKLWVVTLYTNKEWKDEEYGQAFVVSFNLDDYAFCLPCGMIVE